MWYTHGMKSIGELRRLAKLSQRELAEKIGSSSTSVANWEQGIYDPSARQLLKLAAVFGVDPREIVLPKEGTDGDLDR